MELNLSGELPDNLGDILTMRYASASSCACIDDDPAYHRYVKYLRRRDVSLNDKVRAWNHFQPKFGDNLAIINSPQDIKKLASMFPSDVL